MMIMLFSTIEMGSLVGDYVVVNAASRAGVRIAATGAPLASITQRITSITASLNAARLTTTMQYRTSSNGTWSAWTTLSDTTSPGVAVNAAPSSSEVRILLSYSHPLIMPQLFSILADNPPTNNARTINLNAYMQRE